MDQLRVPPSRRLPLFRRRGPPPIAPDPDRTPYTPTDVIRLDSDPLDVTLPGNIMGTKPSKPLTPFTPTYADVCTARAALKSLKLPTELVLQVLDHARYWPSHDFTGRKVSAVSNRADITLLENVFDRANILDLFAAEEALKIKEIEFNVESRDQGWTSEGTAGTYQTSSWLEVSILRPEGTGATPINTLWAGLRGECAHSGDFQDRVRDKGWSLVPRVTSAIEGSQSHEDEFAWFLQANKVAASETYTVVWAEDRWVGNDGSGKSEGFLKALKEGDGIAVWARAKYPGWVCTVDHLRMTVRYGF